MRSIVSVEVVLPMCASPKMCCLKWLYPFSTSLWMCVVFQAQDDGFYYVHLIIIKE
jgi:hypothetical protein